MFFFVLHDDKSYMFLCYLLLSIHIDYIYSHPDIQKSCLYRNKNYELAVNVHNIHDQSKQILHLNYGIAICALKE